MSQNSTEAPSSSQRNLPQIFVEDDGSPLKVFVESNGVTENRPRLIKILRHHGAHICHDVSQARVILVEPNSPQGRQFVRDWGADADKVVLGIAWIRRCTDEGRALLEEDAWGGCGDLDGTPLPDVGDDEEDVPKPSPRKRATQRSVFPRPSSNVTIPDSSTPPLPTPRSTPTNYTKSVQARGKPVTQSLAGPSVPRRNVSSSSATAASPPVSSHPLSRSTSSAEPDVHAQSTQLPFTFNPQHDQSRPGQQLGLVAARPTPPYSPEAMAAYAAQLADTNPDLINYLFREMAQRATPSYPPLWLQNSQISPQTSFFPLGVSQLSPMHMNPTDHSIHGPHSALHSPYGQMASQQCPPLFPFQADGYMPSQPISSPETDSTLMSPELAAVEGHGNGVGRPEVPRRSSTQGMKRLHEVLDQSASTSSRYSNSPLAVDTSQNSVKRQKIPLPNSQPVGIFTQDGKPCNFFIQVQVRNRIDLVKQVKKNGGQICFDPGDADFIILVPQQDKMSEQWMRSVIDLGRYALRPAFVEACLEKGALVDDDEFRMGQAKGTKKTASKGKARRKEVSRKEERSESPTPPPPSASKRLRNGRPSYTEDERAYAMEYAKRAFRLRPILSLSALAEELSQRVPVHSPSSWVGYIHSKAIEFDRLRSEATDRNKNGRSRSVESEDSALDGIPGDESESKPVNGVDNTALDENGVINEQASTTTEKPVDRLEQDYAVIINYFANPPEGVEGDDRLWADLAETHKCLTAETWQEFYQIHDEDVNDRLIAALNLPND